LLSLLLLLLLLLLLCCMHACFCCWCELVEHVLHWWAQCLTLSVFVCVKRVFMFCVCSCYACSCCCTRCSSYFCCCLVYLNCAVYIHLHVLVYICIYYDIMSLPLLRLLLFLLFPLCYFNLVIKPFVNLCVVLLAFAFLHFMH